MKVILLVTVAVSLALACSHVVRFAQHPGVVRGWARASMLRATDVLGNLMAVVLPVLRCERWTLGAEVGGFSYPVKAKTWQQLERESNPSAPGQSEAVPATFYDTETYVDNTTTQLTFFATTKNDRSLSNMQASGQFTHPNFFEIHYVGLDVLRNVTLGTGSVAGAWDDIHRLVLTSRGFARFEMSDKNLPELPISFLHQSGGVTGFGYGTLTAPAAIQYGNNGLFDGGFCVRGAIVIPPKVGFSWTLRWPAVVDLTADVQLRLWMAGVFHRRVL